MTSYRKRMFGIGDFALLVGLAVVVVAVVVGVAGTVIRGDDKPIDVAWLEEQVTAKTTGLKHPIKSTSCQHRFERQYRCDVELVGKKYEWQVEVVCFRGRCLWNSAGYNFDPDTEAGVGSAYYQENCEGVDDD